MTEIREQDFANIEAPITDMTAIADKTVLISGIAGFIAAYFTEYLIFLNQKYDLNLRIIGLARDLASAHRRFAQYKKSHVLTLLEHDLQFEISLNERADIILHAASQASPKYYGSDPVGTALPNVVGTLSLLKFAIQSNSSQFLFFSTGEVYGHLDNLERPIKETDTGKIDPLNVRSCYAESKRMGENLCISFMHQYGVPVKIARIFHTYGPGMKLNDGRVFADFVRNIVMKEPIIMRSHGRAIRPFCYLADTISAVLTILTRGIAGEAYNISNPSQRISVIDLAQLLQRAFPERHIKIEKLFSEPPGYIASQISDLNPDVTKLNALGWFPKVGIEDGFRRTIRSYE